MTETADTAHGQSHAKAGVHDCRVTAVRHYGLFASVTVTGPQLAAIAEPGQFVMIQVPDPRFLLRRPISIFAVHGADLTFLIEARGSGSARLTGTRAGDWLSIQGPLGNGFPIAGVRRALLIGGGIGVAPLQFLADRLTEAGTAVTAAFGFRDTRQARLSSAFHIDHLWLATDDGSVGRRGTVIDLVEALDVTRNTVVFACGPDAMLAAVQRWAVAHSLHGHASLEAHMACGTGSCHGCVVPTVSGYQRVCAEGPVLPLEELVYD
jgi:dihydroorotate dehydrogenase electron transfer subunit